MTRMRRIQLAALAVIVGASIAPAPAAAAVVASDNCPVDWYPVERAACDPYMPPCGPNQNYCMGGLTGQCQCF